MVKSIDEIDIRYYWDTISTLLQKFQLMEWIRKKPHKHKINLKKLKKIKIEDALIKILSNPNHSNKNWITNQFDQMVMCDTAQKSGADAAIIRIHGKNKANF